MTYQPDSKVRWIVQHYSATPIERDFTAADIDAMHRQRGFREIGYHYFIRKMARLRLAVTCRNRGDLKRARIPKAKTAHRSASALKAALPSPQETWAWTTEPLRRSRRRLR